MLRKNLFKILLLVSCLTLVCAGAVFAEDNYGLGNVQIINTQNVNFSTPGDYAVTGKTSTDNINNYVFAIVSPGANGTWNKLYETSGMAVEPQTIFGRFMHNSNTQVILWTRSGTGAYLDYKVLGFTDGVAKVLLQEDGLYAGTIKLHNQEFVVTSGGQNTLYIWNGSRFKGVAQKQEILDNIGTNDKLFTYSIGADLSVTTSDEVILLKVGQRLRWRQTSNNAKARVMVTGNNTLINFDEDNSFKAIKAGKTEITIIPEGYDWDKAKKIEVKISD